MKREYELNRIVIFLFNYESSSEEETYTFLE